MLNRKQRTFFRKRLNSARFKSEMWFLDLLKKNNLRIYKRNWPVNKYFIDFAFHDFKMGVEIDGSSHKSTKEYDNERDLKLNRMGWEIIRIKHGDHSGAMKVINLLKEKVDRKNTDYLIELFL